MSPPVCTPPRCHPGIDDRLYRTDVLEISAKPNEGAATIENATLNLRTMVNP
jgi:hypothetical protein